MQALPQYVGGMLFGMLNTEELDALEVIAQVKKPAEVYHFVDGYLVDHGYLMEQGDKVRMRPVRKAMKEEQLVQAGWLRQHRPRRRDGVWFDKVEWITPFDRHYEDPASKVFGHGVSLTTAWKRMMEGERIA